MYNKAHGRVTYQTYGPLQAATGQYSTTYPRSPGYIPGMPTIERISIESGECSGPSEVHVVDEQLCKLMERIAEKKSASESFLNGMVAAIVRNCGEDLLLVVAIIEAVGLNSKMPLTTALNSDMNEILRDLERDSSDKVAYNSGLIFGDIAVLALDIALFKGAGSYVSGGKQLVLAGGPVLSEGIVIAGTGAVGVATVKDGVHILGDLYNLMDAIDDASSGGGNSLKTISGNRRANQIAREFGYEGAEDLKEAYIGDTKGSEFNMAIDTSTSEIVLIKIKDSSIQIRTGLFY